MNLFSRILFKTTPRASKRAANGTVSLEFDSTAGALGNLLLTHPDGTARPFGGNARAGTPVAAVKAVKTLTGSGTNVSGGAAASGTLTGTTIANGNTVTIGTTVYTFRTALTVPAVVREVLVGASDSDSLDNLIAAINGASGAGTTYSTGTVAHTLVTATAGTGDTMDVAAKSVGTAGNSIATTSTLTAGGFGAATLTSGTNPDTVTIGSKVYTFQNTLTNVNGNVKIGASAAASLTNLFRAINASGGTPGTDYAASTTAHPTFIATNPSGTTVVITAHTAGLAATSATTAETSAQLSWANTTAGVDGTPASKGDMLFDDNFLYFAKDNLTTASMTGWRKIANAAL